MIKEDRGGVIVEVGSHQHVVIEKVFGPSIFMDLRITPDSYRCEWVIERKTILPCPDPDDIENTVDWENWVEWCRIPAQFEWEFKDA